MILSVVIPAWNEAHRIGPTLATIKAFLKEKLPDAELLVVDDGSTDTTASIAEAAEVRLIRLPFNQGKGAAVRAGMLAAKGQWRLFSDADLSTPIEEVIPFLAAAREGADIVVGSRSLPESKVLKHQPWYRELMGRSFNALVQNSVFPGMIDTQCGFKLFSARAAKLCFEPLEVSGFAFDVEVLLRARNQKLKIVEVPVRWVDSPDSRVGLLRGPLSMLGEVGKLWWRNRKG
jgi:dolichyl-phosphate beta-glucosyltransferase